MNVHVLDASKEVNRSQDACCLYIHREHGKRVEVGVEGDGLPDAGPEAPHAMALAHRRLP